MSRPAKVILLVDDNEIRLSIIKVVLESHLYRVIACGSIAEAKEYIGNFMIDLVIARVPRGESVLIAAKTFNPEINGILFSSKIKHGSCADYIFECKQPDSAELLERIRVLVKRKRGPKPLRRIGI